MDSIIAEKKTRKQSKSCPFCRKKSQKKILTWNPLMSKYRKRHNLKPPTYLVLKPVLRGFVGFWLCQFRSVSVLYTNTVNGGDTYWIVQYIVPHYSMCIMYCTPHNTSSPPPSDRLPRLDLVQGQHHLVSIWPWPSKPRREREVRRKEEWPYSFRGEFHSWFSTHPPRVHSWQSLLISNT